MKQDVNPMGENGWDTWLVARYPMEDPQLADEESEDEDPIVVLDTDSGEEADAECDMDTSYDSVFDWGGQPWDPVAAATPEEDWHWEEPPPPPVDYDVAPVLIEGAVGVGPSLHPALPPPHYAQYPNWASDSEDYIMSERSDWWSNDSDFGRGGAGPIYGRPSENDPENDPHPLILPSLPYWDADFYHEIDIIFWRTEDSSYYLEYAHWWNTNSTYEEEIIAASQPLQTSRWSSFMASSCTRNSFRL